MTETITHIAVKKLNNLDIRRTSNKGFDCAQPDICDPSSTVELSLRGAPIAIWMTWQSLENNYNTLPNIKISIDKRNCLIIDAPKVSDTQIITNDIVDLISKTKFKWLGRYDNIINSGGVKLIPEQIEKKLSVVIDHRFFVVGIPDEILGEKLVLIVENINYDLNDEIATSRQKRIRNDKYIQNFKSKISSEISGLKQLSKYEIPKEIYILKKFVETETKKIQRQQTLDLIF
jgi:O-succinylbenzoic acid--CoA ligase